MRRYAYIGPRELLAPGASPSRWRIESGSSVRDWIVKVRQVLVGGAVRATFVVDAEGALWIADRRSEHVSCAVGGDVLSAGEIEFDLSGKEVRVVEISNQSTGYGPEPESWPAVKQALSAAQIPHPEAWTSAYHFRCCGACGALSIVKDGDFFCAMCDSALSLTWNCA